MSLRVLVAALLAQVLGGLTPVWTKLALAGLEPWTLVFTRQAIGLGFLFALLASTESLDPTRALPALVWVFVLAATSTALVTWLWNWALHRTRAGTMGVLIFVQPVVGLTASQLVLGERTGALALLGAALILGGVTLEVRRKG